MNELNSQQLAGTSFTEWRDLTLKDICTLQNGRAYKKKELLSEGKYPVLRVGNFFSNRSWYYSDLELDETKYCDDGDLLYAWSASFGPKIWNEGKAIYHYHIWRVDHDENQVNKNFLYYWFEWDKQKIQDESGAGTTMLHVSKRSMEARKLLVPPIAEQARIVAILDEVFAGIDQTMANTEKNLANAQELFDSYLNRVFAEGVSNCKQVTLDSISECVSVGHVGATSKYYCDPEDGVPFLRSQNVRPNELDLTTVKYITNEFHQKTKKSQLRESDILFVRVGANRGDCCCVPAGIKKLNCANIVFSRLNEGYAPFITHYFNSKQGRDSLLGKTTGSAQGVINTKAVAQTEVPYPNLEKQIEISKTCLHLTEKEEKIRQLTDEKLNALSLLKNVVLHKVFSGELTKKPDKVLNELGA